jgi:adenylate cyclase ExoY
MKGAHTMPLPHFPPSALPTITVTTTEHHGAAADMTASMATEPGPVLSTDIQHIPLIDLVGFPPSHIQQLAALAVERQEIFALRPVAPANMSLIEAGYPTKGLNIKAKSADWGPMSGFLPVKQALSKLEGTLPAEKSQVIEKFQAYMDKSLADGQGTKGNLLLSRERIAELIRSSQGAMESSLLGTETVHISARGPSGVNYQFVATLTTDGQYAISHDGKPIEVLCDTNTKLPITADYDLLLCAPLLDSVDGTDSVREHQPDHRWDEVKHMLKNPVQDEPKGHISKRISDLTVAINERLGRTQNKLVHHGADQHNKHTDLESNFPATFFLPRPLAGAGVTLVPGGGAVLIIENAEQLRAFIASAKDNGFHFDFASGWSPELRSVRRSSFENALGAMRRLSLETAVDSARRSSLSNEPVQVTSPSFENLLKPFRRNSNFN